MDNSQWEVVTKPKKHRNLEKKIEIKAEINRLNTLGPKLEEILPTQQYRNMIKKKNDNKKVKNPSPTKSTTSTSSDKSKSPKHSKKKNNNNKKPQQQQQPANKTENKPKSLELALRGITPEEFENQLELLKQTYPDSELLWLRGIGTYLNTKLPFDCDPIFSGKSNQYPSVLLTKELKQSILNFLDSMGEANLTYFYHSLLIAMCMEMSKNLPIVGYKLLLQLIGQNWPKICSDDMAKTALLRNSYQNRSNICLSIFWAISQGGYKDLMHGIKAWQNLMLSNLEMRSYTKFIVEYFEKILNTAVDQTFNMDQQTFFDIFKVLRTNYTGFPKECQESLKRSSAIFLQKYIASSRKHSNIFLQLFRDINHLNEDSIELDGCISCLLKSDDSFKVWKMNFKKQIVPSALLLEKILIEKCKNGSALGKSKSFQSFLIEAEELLQEKTTKRKNPKLTELIEELKTAQQTSSQQKKKQINTNEKKSGCCKWMLGSFMVFGLIVGALVYDTNINGRGVFAASATGKTLKNAGLLPYAEKAWYTSMSTAARGYKWAEVHVPPYAKPAGQLACDLYKVGRNGVCNAYSALSSYIGAKLPVVGEFLETYIPGLPQTIESSYSAVKRFTINCYDATGKFVNEKIMVGSWSPQNIRKVLNETENAAWDYYYVFHKKVDAYAKLK